MPGFYEASRQLYALLFVPHPHFFDLKVRQDAEITALQTTYDKAKAMLGGLEAAYTRAHNQGLPEAASINAEARRASWLVLTLSGLLQLADDTSEEIRAARQEIDAVNAQLTAVGSSAEHLASHLGDASAALDAIAKLLKLID